MQIIDTGKKYAEAIMQKDAALLESLEGKEAVLHFYAWDGPSATYGHFIKPSDYLDMQAAAEFGLTCAKRPTGGGIVFHLADFAFSVLVPADHPRFGQNTLENYALINRAMMKCLHPLASKLSLLPIEPTSLDAASRQFCMAKPTKYDVLWKGRKIGGAAQRRTKKGFLHQGTISLAPLPAAWLQALLLPGTRVFEAMQQNSAFLLPPGWTEEELEAMRAHLKEILITSFCLSS